MSASPTRRSARPDRSQRKSSALPQRPWKLFELPYRPIAVLSADQVEAIHNAALDILETTGMKVLEPTARAHFRRAGASVDESNLRVRFDRTMLMEQVSKAPASFTLEARNPARNLKLGDRSCVFTSVGGPAYVADIATGRRTGTYAQMCDYLKLIQQLNVIHQEGGGPFEPLDLPAESRHLDLYYAEITLLDKNWQPQGLGAERAIDGLEMGAIALDTTRDKLVDRPIFVTIINTNSPLQLDIPMAEGLMTFAEHGQVNVITPFTLSGAMAPVTIAGALALQHAEALAGITLCQIVRPGVPVMYGGFTSNVDMRSGAPAFGTPEYTQAALASGQLARRIGVPFRSSNVTAANDVDAQAAYESMMALWGAIMGGAHMILHAAGWLNGGLTASFEKLILDAELLQMMQAYSEPFEVSPATLALDAVAEVGPAGHFFGAQHTLSRYETAFYQPILSNWDNYDLWAERGRVMAREKANQLWKSLLAEYEQPPLRPDIDAALKDYMARRKRQIHGKS